MTLTYLREDLVKGYVRKKKQTGSKSKPASAETIVNILKKANK